MDSKPTSRHDRRRLQTRKQIIEAVVQLVLEKGYEGVTIQDITDRADLGRGTFYIHFKDKEEAVWSAIEDGLHATEADAHRQFPGGIPPQPEYYAYRNIFRHAEQNKDLYKVMLGGQGSGVMTARVQNHLAAEMQRDLALLPVPVFLEFHVPVDILAQVITGAVIQLVRWWLETPNRYSAEDMAGLLYTSLHHKSPPKKS
ncbi:MAG: TetR/AcrR family transcriptional regulator [Anaerolineales bacterium]|nr:TetR/AcrR family transcriptional regulator [Anaerolineales bacterium]